MSTQAKIKLTSCQMRVALCTLAALVELAQYLFASQIEQFVCGNRPDGLLEVAHGVKPGAVQPGLAEPSGCIVLGV
ncbi:hypothetical protein [Pseudomonas oryzicola]|uniref:Uncharacterized protein n=1 Tax=Pseudomonas oryzicola TaxID=485876 RepID=A0ABS6QDI4_9PSED|nr:hypothetical protein [Pseudomonas oryzicola]MBV4492268.1 hypothetical protein [Pseudomonas oryzicola]